MSGPASMTVRRGASSPLKSGIRTSTPMPGLSFRVSRIVAAKALAPPSGRSSRATLVTTTWSRRIAASASATRRGSSSSNQVGLPVLIAQNPQARVQVSPRIMTVAVRWSQHSPTLGQTASSQTVFRLRPRSRPLRSWYCSPDGIFARIHSGWRRRGRLPSAAGALTPPPMAMDSEAAGVCA